MKIGEYIFDDDWVYKNDSWRKEFYLDNGTGSDRLEVFKSKTLFPGKYVILYNVNFLWVTHYNMFLGTCITFDNANDAREHVDLFLDKLSRLRAFL